LIKQHARGQSVALLNAERAAGGYRPRHLCGPFRDRFGLTPGKIWSIGAAFLTSRAFADAAQQRHRLDHRKPADRDDRNGDQGDRPSWRW
jgi:hypothetical protein